jgi:hypothetical protein
MNAICDFTSDFECQLSICSLHMWLYRVKARKKREMTLTVFFSTLLFYTLSNVT